jgi:NADH:ubiquinone oxidoreductase subunit 2 (subunit N)
VGLGAFLLSLVGVPGLVGFPAKLHVLRAAVDQPFDGFATVALLNCGLGLVAYGRVIARMLECGDAPCVVRFHAYDACFLASLGAAIVFLGLNERPLFDLASRSIHLLPR